MVKTFNRFHSLTAVASYREGLAASEQGWLLEYLPLSFMKGILRNMQLFKDVLELVMISQGHFN